MNSKGNEHVKNQIENSDAEKHLKESLTIEEQLELFAELLIDQLLNRTKENENKTSLP
jgi:hypothetical protein